MMNLVNKLKRIYDRSGFDAKPFSYKKGLVSLSGESALLAYLVPPLVEDTKDIATSQFSNNGAGRAWGRVLNKLGYKVDAINWDDMDFVPKRKYDLIVIHGGKNFKNLTGSLKAGGKIIYYSTGSYWQHHNQQELKRFAEFEDRTGVALLPDRLITDSEEKANTVANAIISLGNKRAAETYAKFPRVYNLEGASYEERSNITLLPVGAEKHFLFMSGPGNIHKGLDIAIEAFRELPDHHLHIMMSLEDGFADYYESDLKRPNIHPYGYVQQRSSKFYEIVRKCGYIMLLSCSEGSPGSVIEGMTQGLIPLVSRDSHIDIPKAGIMVDNVTVENIKRVVEQAGRIRLEDMNASSQEVLEYVRNHFSIDRFDSELTTILKHITGPSV